MRAVARGAGSPDRAPSPPSLGEALLPAGRAARGRERLLEAWPLGLAGKRRYRGTWDEISWKVGEASTLRCETSRGR